MKVSVKCILVTRTSRIVQLEAWRWTLGPLRSMVAIHGIPCVVELEAQIDEVVSLLESSEQVKGILSAYDFSVSCKVSIHPLDTFSATVHRSDEI